MRPFKHFPYVIHQTSIRNYRTRKKEALACHVISWEVKNDTFRRNWIFRHSFCINNPHWQSGGIKIFLYKFFIVISDKLVCTFLDVLFLLLAVSEKKYIEEFVWVTSLFWMHTLLSMSLFIAFFVYSLHISKWHSCSMVPTKIHNIAMEGIQCDYIMNERSKIWKSLKYLAI